VKGFSVNRAFDVELSAHDLREIDQEASKIKVQGARYPEAHEQISW
jgi:hypothetical protein